MSLIFEALLVTMHVLHPLRSDVTQFDQGLLFQKRAMKSQPHLPLAGSEPIGHRISSLNQADGDRDDAIA